MTEQRILRSDKCPDEGTSLALMYEGYHTLTLDFGIKEG